MRGMKSEDILAIVDFLYYGEAHIYQDNLDTFLNIAEELELKGLQKEGGEDGKSPKNKSAKKAVACEKNVPFPSQPDHVDNKSSSMAVALPNQEVSGELTELDQQIETMIDRGGNMIEGAQKRMVKAFVCHVCGKEAGQKIQIKSHIEANHLEGISIPCNLCEKTFRSRNALRIHKSRYHINCY